MTKQGPDRLTSAELAKVRAVVEAGRSLERDWTSRPDLERRSTLSKFLLLLDGLRDCQNQLVTRLTDLRPHFTSNMTSAHLQNLLIPMERLLGRAVRDDEFLFNESDNSDRSIERRDRIVLCENLRSAFNVGSILRTAESFGFRSAWLAGYTASPDDESVKKTAKRTAY